MRIWCKLSVAWLGLLALSLGSCARSYERVPGIPGHDVIGEEVTRYTSWFEDGIGHYNADFGTFPAGGNREICRQLFGLNSKQKKYVPLYLFSVFDDQGNLLDPWLEPYLFTIQNGKMRLSSNNYVRNESRGDNVLAYKQRPHITKTRYTNSNCYKIALGTLLVVQHTHAVPPLKDLPHLLGNFNWNDGPIFLTPNEDFTSKSARLDFNGLYDAWGTPLIIELSDQRVSVHSKHTDYVGVESFEDYR